jgi:hypothetical protein
MCDDCNEPPRKGTKDVLFLDGRRHLRRTFYYPFSDVGGIKLSVNCTRRPKVGDLGEWKVKARPIKTGERVQVSAWKSIFAIEVRYAARVREGMYTWIMDFLNTKEYAKAPTVRRLRRDLSIKANWLSRPDQLRTKAEAALQAAAFRFLADGAPDDMIAGYAATATSPAVTTIPTKVQRKRATAS